MFYSSDELQQLVPFCLLSISSSQKLLQSYYLFALVLTQYLQLPYSFLPYKQLHLFLLARHNLPSLLLGRTCLAWSGRGDRFRGVLVLAELVAAESELFFYAGIVGEQVVIFLLCLLNTFLQHGVLLTE